MVTLGHFWYNSSPHFVSSLSTAQSGTTSCQDVQAWPTLRLTSSFPHILTTIQSAHFYRTRPGLSWATRLHDQNELSGQLSDRHAFNLVRSANNGTILNQHRWSHMSQPTHRLRPTSIYITPRFCSTIANKPTVLRYPPISRKWQEITRSKHG